jgi:hypothetical protein
MDRPVFVSTSADGSSGIGSPEPFAMPVRINIATHATSAKSPKTIRTPEACFNVGLLPAAVLRSVPVRTAEPLFNRTTLWIEDCPHTPGQTATAERRQGDSGIAPLCNELMQCGFH